ncbi:Predicted choloylglycine hydrolase [Roseovarius nanhaiticus]|uniref:Predicted choloylglycine hydrolase n=1 Tax=Roseovarius nanhaiticus TaxID=573024 RepID=A0A1N7FQT0_9RHOB|nr:C45 family peptidase [Roseovarius nanhaiticus]SEK48209.1 Predicted choloylglycine hydrolase [Roseovarius nanhaiticus]SIS02605.1 Predicted choloylglycine hydrolase [Roseovarius nanhaiticus]
MTTMTFDAVSEHRPGPKWHARWQRSWPAYEAWFIARGGESGPDARACRAAMQRHMPELISTYDQLVAIAGGSNRAARFLSTWCPPTYLGGCSLAARADDSGVRLVRNYDLSPDLNEGLLLRSEWVRPVMGMVEFLWGLSDGINDAGLSIALAYGGRSEAAEGFGITTILRYVLETCTTVAESLAALRRIPSHMAYNIVLADRTGASASVEMRPGGGAVVMPDALATNHQREGTPDRPAFTRTYERHAHLTGLETPAAELHKSFTSAPLHQDRFGEGFGTLFTAEYDPEAGAMRLIWPDEQWAQSLDAFEEGNRLVTLATRAGWTPPEAGSDWTMAAYVDWVQVGRDYAAGRGQPMETYVSAARQTENTTTAVLQGRGERAILRG